MMAMSKNKKHSNPQNQPQKCAVFSATLWCCWWGSVDRYIFPENFGLGVPIVRVSIDTQIEVQLHNSQNAVVERWFYIIFPLEMRYNK